jgi:hypothetical protein
MLLWKYSQAENFARETAGTHLLKKIEKYFISRSHPKFWETFDWFQRDFERSEPLEAGLYDLNRYFRKGW